MFCGYSSADGSHHSLALRIVGSSWNLISLISFLLCYLGQMRAAPTDNVLSQPWEGERAAAAVFQSVFQSVILPDTSEKSDM